MKPRLLSGQGTPREATIFRLLPQLPALLRQPVLTLSVYIHCGYILFEDPNLRRNEIINTLFRHEFPVGSGPRYILHWCATVIAAATFGQRPANIPRQNVKPNQLHQYV